MMKSFKISTIIPVYNTEKFLPETVACILHQTIGFEDSIQLILVNDGSTDNSKVLCEQYESRYPKNVLYIELEQNRGVSVARNTGFVYAKGKYVNFLDSDDKWSENAYRRMYDFLEQNGDDIDMVSSNVWYFDASEDAHALNQQLEGDCIIEIDKEYKKIRSLGSNCLVKRETAAKFPFHEQQKCWEDSVFVNTVILEKKKYGMMMEDVRFYYRVRGDKSSASNLLYRKTKRYYLEDLTYLFDGIYEKSRKYCGNFAPMCQYFIMNAVQVRFQEAINEGMNTSVLDKNEIKIYENILKGILEKIEDSYIKEIAYADELTRKVMLAYKYGIDLRKDISKLKKDQDRSYHSMARARENNKLLLRWLKTIQRGKKIEAYFEEHNYKEIAIYGISDIGKFLIEELKDTKVIVQYGIDQNADRISAEIPVHKPTDVLPKVELIVVTAVYFYEDIDRMLREKGVKSPVISFNEILDFMEWESV